MKVKLYFDGGNLGRLAVAMVFASLLCFWIRFPVWMLLGFGGLYFFIKSLKIELSEKLPWLWSAVMLGTGSVFSAYQVQYLLLDAELRAKITDTKMFQNVLCCLVIYLAVQIFTNNTGLTCIISYVAIMSLAGINYFVYLFRGNEFIFSDLKSISTGLSVAGNYEFVLDERAGHVILLSILYVAFIRKLHVSFKKRLWMGAICLSLVVFCCAYIGQKTENYVTETWEQKGSYRNGYILNFMLSIRDTFVGEPEDYSDEAVAALEARYSETGETETAEKPTIIVVMNESYADLSVVGEFSTNMEVTPFYNSLQENTLKGYALSSVFGAKTPNSEWEFMTGNSMAYLPGGSVVYQQYISDTPTSIVSNLKNEGYTCVAMHPYYETGWSRNAVYPDMGFDEMYFIDDFDNTAVLREYITD
ncbi:MAG: sulfatase-like hydrolase/transferase, partial [Roseburia sp.]|nr:sulfatase-like hydrolase/transferase [Roseburia sp.]